MKADLCHITAHITLPPCCRETMEDVQSELASLRAEVARLKEEGARELQASEYFLREKEKWEIWSVLQLGTDSHLEDQEHRDAATAKVAALRGAGKCNPPARIAWMHARCVYIREMVSEGDSLEEIARTLGVRDVAQVALLSATDPAGIIEPWTPLPSPPEST